jgi:hypothetical protein
MVKFDGAYQVEAIRSVDAAFCSARTSVVDGAQVNALAPLKLAWRTVLNRGRGKVAESRRDVVILRILHFDGHMLGPAPQTRKKQAAR